MSIKKERVMSDLKRCDICGEIIESTTKGVLDVFHFYDGYNTDSYNSTIDICESCLMEKIGKEVIMTGRTF